MWMYVNIFGASGPIMVPNNDCLIMCLPYYTLAMTEYFDVAKIKVY